MRNQKAIDAARFEQGIWKFKDGTFHAVREINRKPFGTFYVELSVAMGGMCGVNIKNETYPELYWYGTFPSYKLAVERIEKRFEVIDELSVKLAEHAKQAEKERNRILSSAIGSALKGNKTLEGTEEWTGN